MLNWDRWQTLLVIFRKGTYSRAARSLGVDATTVGRRLQQLEKHFGCQLFMRQDGRLYPTARCESLLSHIESASEALRAAEQDSAVSDDGAVWRDLRLNAFPYLCINLFAPAIADLTKKHRIRVELMGTANRLNLSRREADIIVRLLMRRPDLNVEIEQIGLVAYAIYCAKGADPESLSWGGLLEGYVDSPEGETMVKLAGAEGFQYRAYQFNALQEIVAAGGARAMLPRFVADRDSRLMCVGDTVLECPMWMLSHVQDRDVPHLKAARSWIRALALDKLAGDLD